MIKQLNPRFGEDFLFPIVPFSYEGLEVNGGDPVSFGQYTGVKTDLWLNLAKEIETKLYDSKTEVKNDPSNIIHDPIY